MSVMQTPLIGSFLALTFSEFGDKTFIIAAIMAMKYSRLTVFAGCMLGISIVQLCSALIGKFLDQYIPDDVILTISLLLFFFYGSIMIKDAIKGRDDDDSEAKEISESVENLKNNYKGNKVPDSAVFMSCFYQNLVGEWGDKSQITTIALSSQFDLVPVLIGTLFGLIFCTGVAVLGGNMLAKHISERSLNLGGGLLMIYFSIETGYKIYNLNDINSYTHY